MAATTTDFDEFLTANPPVTREEKAHLMACARHPSGTREDSPYCSEDLSNGVSLLMIRASNEPALMLKSEDARAEFLDVVNADFPDDDFERLDADDAREEYEGEDDKAADFNSEKDRS